MQRPAVGQGIPDQNAPHVAWCDPVAARVHEQRGRLLPEQPRPRVAEVRGDRLTSRIAEGQSANLRALAEHRDGPPAEVDRAHVEPAALADAKSRAVEQLEERRVAVRASHVSGVGHGGRTVEQRARLVAARHTRQLLGNARRLHARSDVARHHTVTP